MGLAGDDRVADLRMHRRPVQAQRFGGGDGGRGPVPAPRPRSRNGSNASGRERERAERAKRERIERERAERDRALQERLEQRRRARLERLRREREQRDRHDRYVWSRRKRRQTPTAERGRRVRPEATRARIDPSVKGPVRRRARAAENRRRASTRRRGLFWPTAKAGLAVTVVLGLSAGLGSVLGLPVPGLDSGAGRQSLASSASIFGIDCGHSPGSGAGLRLPPDRAARLRRLHRPLRCLPLWPRPRGPGHLRQGRARPRSRSTTASSSIAARTASRYSGGRGNYVDDLRPRRQPQLRLHAHAAPAGRAARQTTCTPGSCSGDSAARAPATAPISTSRCGSARRHCGADTKPIDPLSYLRRWPQTTPG